MTDQSQVDNTGSYYSINVPANDMQSYFRLGMPDGSVENNLPTTPSSPHNTPSSVNGFNAGVLLYTQGAIQQVAPAVTSWSGDSLTAVKDGDFLVSASYSTPKIPLTYNYSFQATYNTAIGNVSNFVTGNQLAYWLVNSASTGLGGLLWSNIGLTQNVFFGQIVNLINNNIDVQGIGEAKVQTNYEVLTSSGIDLLVEPAATVSAAAMAGKLRTSLTAISIATSAILATANDLASGLTGDISSDPDTLRKAMASSAASLATATGLVFLLQIVVASAGRAVKAVAEEAKLAADVKVSISNAGLTLQASPDARLMITPAGIFLDAATLTKEVTMNEVSADLSNFSV